MAKTLCSIKDKKEFGLDTLAEEISLLEKELSGDYQDIGFCHNDLQYGNIMMDEETRLITIIVSFLFRSINCFCGFRSSFSFFSSSFFVIFLCFVSIS